MADPRERDDLVDPRLRAALEPGAGQAERVAREALEPRLGAFDRLLRRVFEWRPSFAGRHPLRSLSGLSALVLGGWFAILAVWLVLSLLPGSPAPPEPALARHSLSNRNGVIVVRRPDGGAAFLHSRERPTELPRGMMLIVRGEIRP
ncbi:MAG TPA: hypothetical protein VJG13_01180 [Thermoanaerobaculia bacterium]|nr:hypothetical protein [Thermoanaerobaculia bacterium]